MAKAPAPTKTRLLTTVNARYYPVEGVADAYCLDGKFPGKRELRSANITLDREGRGFFTAVFAYPSDARNRQAAWQDPLKALSQQLDDETGDIDSDINDLAEAALDVTGGLKLSDEIARQPYFAGTIIRDGELAAVTVAEGLAFIYRQEVLYPLTGHSKDLESMDLYGDPVEGIDDFIAGEAGAIRYSNIAQLEEGDILLLCNGDLLEVIGQKNLMQLLAEAEDSMDAAGLILTAAASQMPGTPIQLAVSVVEAIKTAEAAATPKFSLGRFATQAMEPVVLPEIKEEDPALARTQRYERQDMLDGGRRLTEEREDKEDDLAGWGLPPLPVSEATEPFEAVVPRMGEVEDTFDPFEDPFRPSRSGLDSFSPSAFPEKMEEREGEGQLPVFAYSPEAQKRSRQQASAAYEDYGRSDEIWDTGDDLDAGSRDYDPYGEYDDYDDYPAGYGRRQRKDPDKVRRLVFYAILIAIIVICVIALIKLVFGGSKKPVETEPTVTQSLVVPTDPPPVTTQPTTTEPEPTEPASVDKIHVVVAGDTWWGICMRYYDRASESLCEKLAEYNGKSVGNLFVGNEIAIPPLSELLGD